MIAVIFEVRPDVGMRAPYLDLAARMRPLAERVDGFISVERFQSVSDDGKMLSLSFWRDEAALDEWRRLEEHRAMQSKGRTSLFADYRLRVASVIRDYGMSERDEAPADSRALHDVPEEGRGPG